MEAYEEMQEEYRFACPHCWQAIQMTLDLSAGGQSYVQDCEVCCNPIDIRFEVEDGQLTAFDARSLEQ